MPTTKKTPTVNPQTDAIAEFMAAEVRFLTAFGWAPVAVTMKRRGGDATVVHFRDTQGNEMDRLNAVRYQKDRCNFPE